jgi:hypothetical protein
MSTNIQIKFKWNYYSLKKKGNPENQIGEKKRDE